MKKEAKDTPLEIFNHKLCDVSILRDTSFFELYPWYFYDITNNLKKEIINNLTALPEAKFNAYLTYIKEEIENTYVYDPNECIIERWLIQFGVNENDFPFYFHKELKLLLTPIHTDQNLENDNVRLYFSIQREFYLYAVQLEVNELNSFIGGLLEDNMLAIDDEITATETKYPRIFIDQKAYELFEKLRDEFEGKKNILANFSFVFHRMKKDGLIFDHLKQLEFINFLSTLNIDIDRIKPQSQMGNEDFRESIYNNLKL